VTVSVWDVVFAIVLVARVFRSVRGRVLVRQSYAEAAVRELELKLKRQAPRVARGPRRRIKP
jgi:hypothetical protein